MKLSIAIPAYNEEKRLPEKLEPYITYLNQKFPDYEMVFVDDGSTDNTLPFLNSQAMGNKRIKVIHNDKNRGRGFGMRTAVLASSGNYILETDADLPVPPEYILEFMDILDKNPQYDILMGSREHPGSIFKLGQPPLRVFAGKVFHVIFRIFSGIKFNDVMCGFKMFRHDAAKDIFNHIYDEKYLAAAEIIFVAEKFGYQVKELPIAWEDDRRSKVSVFKDTFRTLYGLLQLRSRDLRGYYKKK